MPKEETNGDELGEMEKRWQQQDQAEEEDRFRRPAQHGLAGHQPRRHRHGHGGGVTKKQE